MVNVETAGSWEEFDISQAVASWIEDSSSNLGLQIICDTQALTDVITFQHDDVTQRDASLKHLPVVDIETQQVTSRRRAKRDALREDCTRGDGQSECCRYPLHIRFSDIGWDDWVLAPAGFRAYFCDGSCPVGAKSGNRFSTILAKLHASNPLAAPSPCCGASKLAPLKLLVRTEDNKVEKISLEDMVVEQCRCF